MCKDAWLFKYELFYLIARMGLTITINRVLTGQPVQVRLDLTPYHE